MLVGILLNFISYSYDIAMKALVNKNAILAFAFQTPPRFMHFNLEVLSVIDSRKKLTAKVYPKCVECWGV